MGRNNADFQASALYHGSYHPFEIGDVVEPSASRKLAFASPQLETARMFAKGVNRKTNTTGGRVFEVEPVDPNEGKILEPVKMKGAYGHTTEVASQKGFKVVREVEHFAPDGKTIHKSAKANCRSKACK